MEVPLREPQTIGIIHCDVYKCTHDPKQTK